jgi:sugar/nucleoside kinase (ribokinase family)
MSITIGNPLIDFIIAGSLKSEYVIPISGNPAIDFIGGNLSYCYAGLSLWNSNIGLISKVSQDFPLDRLKAFSDRHCDLKGIIVSHEKFDHRSFFAYQQNTNVDIDHPMAHFARINHEYPKSLLGYQAIQEDLSKGNPYFIRSNEIPVAYLDASAAHLCPADIRTHSSICSTLRKGLIRTVTVDPSEQYMHSNFWPEFRPLLQDVTALLVSEKKIRNLFNNNSMELWEMAEAICSMGAQIVVIKRASKGQLLYDNYSKKRFQVPAYPIKVESLAGAGDAFCGGFLFGYKESFDPLKATLYGNISASVAIEVSNPWLMLEPLPGLPEARFSQLRKNVRKL